MIITVPRRGELLGLGSILFFPVFVAKLPGVGPDLGEVFRSVGDFDLHPLKAVVGQLGIEGAAPRRIAGMLARAARRLAC